MAIRYLCRTISSGVSMVLPQSMPINQGNHSSLTSLLKSQQIGQAMKSLRLKRSRSRRKTLLSPSLMQISKIYNHLQDATALLLVKGSRHHKETLSAPQTVQIISEVILDKDLPIPAQAAEEKMIMVVEDMAAQIVISPIRDDLSHQVIRMVLILIARSL